MSTRASRWMEDSVRTMRGGGERLDLDRQIRLSFALRCDLNRVRIHAHEGAAALARTLTANAFTLGTDIFFSEGAYRPWTDEGQKLLVHELIHVKQYLSGRVPLNLPRMAVSDAGGELENEACAFAETMTSNSVPRVAARNAVRRSFAAAWTRDLLYPTQSCMIQRSPATIVLAANVPPPPGNNGPATCHQAALGWLLAAEGYTHSWQLLREINNTFFLGYDLSMWARDRIYNISGGLDLATLTGLYATLKPSVGDILYTLDGMGQAAHSMVVVNTAPNQIFIRGFNNAGTFNYPAVAPPAPAGAYDALDRDVCDVNLWNVAGTGFGANNAGALLRWVRYQNAATKIRAALQHWSYSPFRTPGWRHAAVGGCPPDCPH